ncbi:pentatricopeptide repeat-containing protein, mitochondrial-like [Heracleum sosnowskyi]|uniref:Pentatricopeptide repeat-containing protein, mitochondrial-like n=1 Tax=Heracleum sosnowskyi TaxID=360622 RepID=A0AAD8JDQ0_9APIA|nr:pentatricopeptide repeat-containing protein, mitochondrial-like [Heracleum sosnowskyi]
MINVAEDVIEFMIRKGQYPNVVTLMDGYCLRGEVDEALAVLETMKRRGIVPNIHTYNILINGYCKKLKVDRAVDLFQQLPREGLSPTIYTYNTILQGYFLTGRHVEARKFFDEKMMLNKGLKINMVTCYTMLDGLFQNRYMDAAMSFFHVMQCNGITRYIGSYNIQINGLCKKGNFEKAKNIGSMTF